MFFFADVTHQDFFLEIPPSGDSVKHFFWKFRQEFPLEISQGAPSGDTVRNSLFGLGHSTRNFLM